MSWGLNVTIYIMTPYKDSRRLCRAVTMSLSYACRGACTRDGSYTTLYRDSHCPKHCCEIT